MSDNNSMRMYTRRWLLLDTADGHTLGQPRSGAETTTNSHTLGDPNGTFKTTTDGYTLPPLKQAQNDHE